ncbi:hypothetical protein C8R43DRAFT_1115812 [Mycena crocata]|nr:hypothetical protein C8R43DRAFT_1115812 [Mycena crocata]
MFPSGEAPDLGKLAFGSSYVVLVHARNTGILVYRESCEVLQKFEHNETVVWSEFKQFGGLEGKKLRKVSDDLCANEKQEKVRKRQYIYKNSVPEGRRVHRNRRGNTSRLKTKWHTKSIAGDAIYIGLIALRESSEAFPPLRATVGLRVQRNKDTSHYLARRAVEILEIVAAAIPDPTRISPRMATKIARFQCVLQEIHQEMSRLRGRRGISRFIRLNHDEDTLESFKGRLDDICQSFLIESAIHIELGLDNCTPRLNQPVYRFINPTNIFTFAHTGDSITNAGRVESVRPGTELNGWCSIQRAKCAQPFMPEYEKRDACLLGRIH